MMYLKYTKFFGLQINPELEGLNHILIGVACGLICFL